MIQKNEFNPEIYEKLKEQGITEQYAINEALCYLLCIYYEIPVLCIGEKIVIQVNLTKIVERDYNAKQTNPLVAPAKWNISLFVVPEQIDNNWEWVDKEYRIKFKSITGDKAGDKNGCIAKMKQFFAANPEVRKQDVLTAADLYINPFRTSTQNAKYMQRADYFISKKEAGAKLSRLEQYLEQIKDNQKLSGGNNRRFEVLT